MPRLTPDEIIKIVEQQDQDTASLRDRMEEDYRLARLESYDAGDNYEAYTSNEPGTFLHKVIAWLIGAELIIRVPLTDQGRGDRERANAKEKFLLGMLRAADEELAHRLEPSLREQLAWYICARGWYAGRALLTKQDDGSTIPDVSPWDPLHVYWGMGRRGLQWACYVTELTPEEVKEQYGAEVEPSAPASGFHQRATVKVYDYYNQTENMVVAEGEYLKRPTPHGSSQVPVFLGYVGSVPVVQSRSGLDTLPDVGESLFQHNRKIYESNNLIMSVMLENVVRSRDWIYKIFSRDGSKGLQEPPHEAGAEISLRTGEEDIVPLELGQMAQETGAFMGLVAGQMQRGAIPYSVYGDVQFQLSGFAINSLRQGVETIVLPRLRAKEQALLQICNLLFDQYCTDQFEVVSLSGRHQNREWFQEYILPETIRGIGVPEIKLVPSLPQDDMAKFSMAQVARDGPIPLLPDSYIMDNILGIQNADLVQDMVKEQLAERASPMAQLYSLMLSAQMRGRFDLAQIYYGELLQMMAMQQMQLSGGGAGTGAPGSSRPGTPSGGGPGAPQGGGMPTFDPRVLPNAMLGMRPPVPVPQGGPNVPPGSPRPGAQSNQERLNRIGLFSANGR